MRNQSLRSFAFGMAVLLCAAGTWAQGKAGQAAPDFPAGSFNDGGRYRVSDFEGKVLVLFFYEKDCPSCRKSIPERNAIVKQYQGKPVKFIAVAAGDTMQQAKSYAGGTKLAMPVFADPLSLMERRYGQSISLQNIYQVRVIGPDGKIVGYRMTPEDIDKALAKVDLRFNPEEFHAKVRPAVDQFEWNQHAAGMKLLRPLLKNSEKEVAESAAKLLEAIQLEGRQWLDDAAGLAEADPVKSYDLYTRAATAFGPSDEMGKKAAEALKPLKANDAVKKELEARKAYDRILNAMAIATPQQKDQVVKFAADVVKKYPGTPTAQAAEALQKELGG